MTQRLDNNQVGRYLTARRGKQIVRHTGLFALPVAEMPPGTASGGAGTLADWSPVCIVRAHAAFQEEVDAFEYEKEDAPPVVPDMTDAGSLVFLGGEITVPVPGINTDGGMTWSAAGEYHYVRDAATSDLKRSGVVLPAHPWVLATQVADALNPGPATPGTGALPTEVDEAGVGPRVGWSLSQGAGTGGVTDPTTQGYALREPTYMPGAFFSDDLTVGPTDYSGLGG